MCHKHHIPIEAVDQLVDGYLEAAPGYMETMVALSALLTAFVHDRVEDPPTLLIANRLYQFVRNTCDDIDTGTLIP